MLDVQIKQEIGSDEEDVDVEPPEIEMAESLPNGQADAADEKPAPTIEKARPRITVKQPERLLRPQRIVQPSEVPVPIPSHVKITRVHTMPPKMQAAQMNQHQRLATRARPVSISVPSAVTVNKTSVSERNKVHNNISAPEQIPLHTVMNLATNIQQSVELWVDSNRAYNTHRMEMERQNADSLAVIAASLRTFSQAILNYSQQGSNHRS